MAPSNKLSRPLIVSIVAVVLVVPVNLVNAESLGSWKATTNYPLGLNGVSCVSLSSSIVCVGGVGGGGNSHNQVYQAATSDTGTGTWSPSTSYPTPIDSASCVNASTGIYCVGGEDGSSVLNDVYYAPLTSSGIGSWTSQAAYPNSLAAPSCVAYSGYLYCVGGFDDNGNEVSSTYYASISSGLGPWTATTQYPLAVDSESCVAFVGYIYCIAGETESGSNQNSPISNVYYAPLSPSGIGQWTAALSYPISLAATACAQYLGYVYCVGGFDSNLHSGTDTYFGALSSSGIASWSNASPYPIAIDTSTCVTNTGYLYCVSGTSDTQSGSSIVASSYYAPIMGQNTTTTATPEFPFTVAVPLTLALGLFVVVGLMRIGKKRIPSSMSG